MAQPPLPIFCPFPAQENPHTAAARAQLDNWVRDLGLVRKQTAWERFARADFAWFAARTYPTADAADLNLVADWFAWLFLVDDQLDDGEIGRDPDRAGAAMDGLLAVLDHPPNGDRPNVDRPNVDPPSVDPPSVDPPSVDPPNVDPPGDDPPGVPAPAPAAAALADLWARTAPRATPAWRHRFRRHAAECFAAARWEAGNRVRGVVPEEAAYIAKRRHTGAIYVCMDLIDVVEHLDLPAAVYHSGLFQDTLDAASNVVCWTNDVYSLEKERALGEHHNLVSVVERSRGLSPAAALAWSADAISTETRRFLDLERRLLAAFPAHGTELGRHLAGMRSWIRGNLDWSSATERYRQPDAALARTGPAPQSYLEAAVMPPA